MNSPGPSSVAGSPRARRQVSCTRASAHIVRMGVSIAWPRMLALLAILPLLVTACDDGETNGGGASGRVVYYCLGAPPSAVEFRRQDLDTQQDALLSSERVVAVSDVAANGRVLYQTLTSDQWPHARQLYGRCEGGQIIPVPMPVSADPSVEYLSVANDGIPGARLMTISHAGHHAAFFSYARPVGSTDSTTWSFHLCVFDCGSWTMKTADLGVRIQEHFMRTQSDFTPNLFIPSAVWLSHDGSVAAMQVEARRMEHHLVTASRTVLLGGTLSQLSVLAVHPTMDWNATVFDGATSQLYALSFNGAMRYDCRGGSGTPVSISLPGSSGFAACSGGSGEIAWYDSNTPVISMLRLSDGRLQRIALDRARPETQFPDTPWLLGENGWCGMSPDGEWIAVVVRHAQDEGLYVMRRDGSDPRRLARGAFAVPPVVSDVVPL